MKRWGGLFEKIVTFDNLLLASRKALRGKKKKPDVAFFYFHLENELLILQKELLAGTYRPRPYSTFIIHEPKRRKICAAEIRDRVIHHSICNVIEPVLERCMIYDTYACRPNKGTHAAIRRAQEYARKYAYVLQCDVQKYFDSIDHTILKTLLQRKFKDKRLLELLGRIIDYAPPDHLPGKGLPIGNLTSQYFANFYLGSLDHVLKDHQALKGYVRYMDDFLLFHNEKEVLYDLKLDIERFLNENLRLRLKEKANQVAPTNRGISFLGCRIYPSLIRLQSKKWYRFKKTIRKLEHRFLMEEISEEELSMRVSSMIGQVLHVSAYRARKTFFDGSIGLV